MSMISGSKSPVITPHTDVTPYDNTQNTLPVLLFFTNSYIIRSARLPQPWRIRAEPKRAP